MVVVELVLYQEMAFLLMLIFHLAHVCCRLYVLVQDQTFLIHPPQLPTFVASCNMVRCSLIDSKVP